MTAKAIGSRRVGICWVDGCDEEAGYRIHSDGYVAKAEALDEAVYCWDHAVLAATADEPAPAEPIKMSVMLSHKMGLPDYSSVEASMHISFTGDHSDEEVARMVERGKVAWDAMAPKVTAQARAARAAKGWE